MTDIAKAAQESSDLALWQAYCEKKMALEDAANEIERLRAECQRLAGDVSRAHKDALTWMERAAAVNAEIEAARQRGRIEGAAVGAEELAAARREGIEAAVEKARNCRDGGFPDDTPQEREIRGHYNAGVAAAVNAITALLEDGR